MVFCPRRPEKDPVDVVKQRRFRRRVPYLCSPRMSPWCDQTRRVGDSSWGASALTPDHDPPAAAQVRENYLDERVEDLAVELDIPLPDLLQACAASK